jgi:hypothetical protein
MIDGGREMMVVRAIGGLVFAAMLIISAPAVSEELTNGELYSFCNSKDEMAQTACRFYVLGVVQGVEMGDGGFMDYSTRNLVERRKTIICLPDGVPQSQMVAIVKETMIKLFAAYPGDKELPAISTVAVAMNRRFPCNH